MEKDSEVIITDIVGQQIMPGNLLAFSRSGRGEKDLNLGLVSRITSSSLFFLCCTKNIYYLQHKKSHLCVYCDTNKEKYKTDPRFRYYFTDKGNWTSHSYSDPMKCHMNRESIVDFSVLAENKTYINSNVRQDNMIVLQNPLFSLENENIAFFMQIAEQAKDEGFFPKSYKFGESIVLTEDDILSMSKIRKDLKNKIKKTEKKVSIID